MAPVARLAAAVLALLALPAIARDSAEDAALVPDEEVDAPVAATQNHHHHHHRHHHKKHHKHHHEQLEEEQAPADAAAAVPAAKAAPKAAAKVAVAPKVNTTSAVVTNIKRVAAVGSKSEGAIVAKMKQLEGKLAEQEKKASGGEARRSLRVNGPLPADFNSKFAQAVALATKCSPSEVKVVGALPAQAGVVQVLFEAPARIADETVDEAADPDSALATGPLQSFLVERSPEAEEGEEEKAEPAVSGPRIDVDAAMPYGDLEPFGREDTAQELTEQAVTESNEMVDQLERAEVAEEKRAVFRALTRLRGAAVTSFDGIARAQTGNIDEYNKVNKWRKTHPLHHLADEESDVSRWAFPNNADF